jgi:GT2 family glycosyltransferase
VRSSTYWVRGCWVLSSTRAEDRLSKVAVAVVNWNDLSSTMRCLASVRRGSPESILVLVDNGSDEDSQLKVEAQSLGAHVVSLVTNRGYAGGCNAGAETAIANGAEYLLFLNNDTTIDANTLPVLIEHSDQHPQSILAPKIVYADRPDIVWSAGGRVSGPLLRNEHLGEGEAASSCQISRRVDWATACALFLSVESFRRLGPMDEAYFLYLEDVDWCLRGTRLGIDTWFVPGALVRHEVSRTLGAAAWSDHIRYYAYRNRYRLAFRYGSIGIKPIVVADALWTLAKAGIRSAISSAHRRDAHYHMRTRAVLDFFRGRWGPYPSTTPRGSGVSNALASK